MARARTFLALPLDAGLTAAAVALQGKLAEAADGVRWTAPAGFHLTLQFLGEVDDRELATVCRAADKACRAVPPFTLGLGGVGAFPNPRRPRTVWAGVTTGRDELLALFAALDEGLLETGSYRREGRPYAPHLTLGRVTADDAPADLSAVLAKFATWAGGTLAVDQVVVFTSQLRRDGPEYTAVGRVALRGRPG
jgi:2'-5' RNA ligase